MKRFDGVLRFADVTPATLQVSDEELIRRGAGGLQQRLGKHNYAGGRKRCGAASRGDTGSLSRLLLPGEYFRCLKPAPDGFDLCGTHRRWRKLRGGG